MRASLAIAHGQLKLKQLVIHLPEDAKAKTVQLTDRDEQIEFRQEGRRLTVSIERQISLHEKDELALDVEI